MKKILVFLPTTPFPARKNGMSVRYYPLLQYLSQSCNIDLVIFSDENEEEKDQSELKKITTRYTHIKQTSKTPANLLKKIWVRIISATPFTTPLAFLYYEKGDHLKALQAFTHGQSYDSVILTTPAQVSYIPELKKRIPSKKWVVDFVDSVYLHRKRQLKKSLWEHYQVWKLKKWESKMIDSVDQSIYISKADANATISPNNIKKPAIIPNGVLIDDYSDNKLSNIGNNSIGFLGNMSYKPNILAAQILYKDIFLPLKEKIPSLSLHIIGRKPVPSIQKLAETEGVYISGQIDNIWPYVNAVSLFVLPLKTGAGQQNKILEIMYAGRPVIFSQLANAGISASHNNDCIICDHNNIADWVQATHDLINNPDKAANIAASGRHFIAQNYDWEKIKVAYKKLVL